MTIHIPATWLPWLAAAVVLLGLWVFVYQLWLHYLAVMALKRADQTTGLKPAARLIGYWHVLPAGVVLDWLGNVLLTVPFLDPPHTPGELVTGRLQRYVSADPALAGWRARASWAFSAELLNDFDLPHGHIIKEPSHG